jgi:hypothetical protein
MRSIWQGMLRTLFWSYDRGSWPYDLMVIAIVVFVLWTPRRLFHDQPQSAALPTTDVQLIAEDIGSSQRTYRVDAALLPLPKRSTHPTPELERETHDILGRTVDDLKGHTFQVLRIDPVANPNGSIAYYDVFVKW